VLHNRHNFTTILTFLDYAADVADAVYYTLPCVVVMLWAKTEETTRVRIYKPPYSDRTTYKSVKIAAIHSNCTTLTLTLNPKLKITPFLTLTLNWRWAVRGFVIMLPGPSTRAMSDSCL